LNWREPSLQYGSFSSEVDVLSSKIAGRVAETTSPLLVLDLQAFWLCIVDVLKSGI
jgi:hypothetical protein